MLNPRVFYYAFPVVWIIAALDVLLLGSSSGPRNTAVILLGAVVAVEGLVLAADTAGAASTFASKLNSNPRSALSFFRPWSVRVLLGGGTALLGGLLIWGGVRYL